MRPETRVPVERVLVVQTFRSAVVATVLVVQTFRSAVVATVLVVQTFRSAVIAGLKSCSTSPAIASTAALALLLASTLTAGQTPTPAQPAGPPQAPPRAAAPVAPAAGTATIRGRVTSSDGNPLRRARVSLAFNTPGAARPPDGVSTNAQGQYEIKNLPAGSYRVSAGRAGYLTIQHGQRRPLEQGRSIEVRDGQVVERIDIALPKAAVLAGVIADELGEPYPGVRVEALQHRYMNGRLVPFPSGTTTTDDLGRFRIPGLLPGSYYVMASSKESVRAGKDKQEIFSYGFSYYPGVTGDRAQAINLAIGQTRTDLDFRLSLNRVARVSGRVESPEGAPLEGRTVSLTFEYRGIGAVANPATGSTRTGRDGTFEIRDVPPGTYRLLGAGSMSVDVTGADIDNLLLIPRVGSTVSGSVVTDEGTSPPFPPSGLRILLEPGNGEVLSTVRVQPVNPDWSFRLTSVGGPFRFRFSGLRDDWMLKTVLLNDKDITDADFDVPTGDKQFDGLQMVITRKIGHLSGDVLDKDGKPTSDATIVLFADDPRLWGPGTRQIRTTRPDDKGRFSIGSLPAGIYRAAARDFIQDGQWLNAEYLESVRGESSRVEVSEGGSATVTLKVP